MSKAAINDLIEKKVQPLWKVLGDFQASWTRERAEMKQEIDELKSSKDDLKNQIANFQNQVENVSLNNEQLVDEVEKMRIENAGLRRTLNEMEIAGQFQQLKTV
jgi:predicted  nucleic acid-binding Zn-ribbon protein